MDSPLCCWRCDAIVPMPSEAECVRMEPAPVRLSLGNALKAPHRDDALGSFHRITSLEAVVPSAIRHHHLALHGPPCGACGEPLRTPRASLCAACGVART